MPQTEKEKKAKKDRLKRLGMLRRVPPFPGIKHSNKFTIAYAVDTSGSMSANDLRLGLSELQQIQKADSDVKIRVMHCDAVVAHEYTVGPNDQIEFEIYGRGGTNFDPIFEHVQKLLRSTEDAPDILIFATDGYAPPPTIRLPIPVVWLITPTGQAVCKDAGHITLVMKDYLSGEVHDI
jgi:predicted metal-dependent peptidase